MDRKGLVIMSKYCSARDVPAGRRFGTEIYESVRRSQTNAGTDVPRP